MSFRLDGRVAIVTGAGGGLGRQHALALAQRGASVVVNDVGASVDGQPQGSAAAQSVVDEIVAAGGRALAHGGSVTDFEDMRAMAQAALTAWGRIDMLVCNAGILRDKTFAKMDLSDFARVMDVHVMGAANACKAVWEPMRAQNHGRIVLTTSSSGLFGSFGQSNYGAAKMALVGLMQTLALEGARHGIRVNCLSPTASTRMTELLLPFGAGDHLKPSAVSPALLALLSDQAPNRTVLCAGGGAFEAAHVTLTRGIYLDPAAPDAVEQVLARMGEITDREGDVVPESGSYQGELEVRKANQAACLEPSVPQAAMPGTARGPMHGNAG